MRTSLSIRSFLAAALVLATGAAAANNVAYISSSSGYMLHNSAGNAVTADWRGQAPLQGFSGYGQIQLSGQCLTGRSSGQPLRWEGCVSGEKAQIWKLSGSRLNNEINLCADVEGGRGGAGVRVLAWQCKGGSNQYWRAHTAVTVESVANGISNTTVRNTFLNTARSASPGTVISTQTGQVVAAGGANAVAAGGANVVAAGGGNVVAAGGRN
ncbi:MAG: ricin-type beta-trefoil lectin domain protein [Rhodoferax sp.]